MNMELNNKLQINSSKLTNITFAFFPLSFILGNLIININLVLFCFLGILHLKSQILKDQLLKSIFFFRFFLMLIIVYFLVRISNLNFKYFFFSAAFFPILISLDVIFQYIFGFNLIGLKSIVSHNSSFFDNELISGGYIQNFSFFSILFLLGTIKNTSYIKSILILISILILSAGILLSGNRMPLALFLLGLVIIPFINKELRKTILASLLLIFIFFWIASSLDKQIKNKFQSYFSLSKNIVTYMINDPKSNKSEINSIDENKSLDADFDLFWVVGNEGHLKLFNTAMDTWKKNIILGNGIKSFRKDCVKFQAHKENRMCSTHPHNYYLEILTETGLVGLITIIILAIMLVIFLFKNRFFLRGNNLENFILLASVISLILEMFPIKSSGSIFSTYNATYITLITSIILSHQKKDIT